MINEECNQQDEMTSEQGKQTETVLCVKKQNDI